MSIFARALAEASDAEQADFFNKFSEHLTVRCHGPRGRENQICQISYGLKQSFVDFCRDVVTFNELHEREYTTLGEKVRRERDILQRLEEERRTKQEAEDEITKQP